MRVVMWGTYDKGKPRARILKRGLVENGVEVIECHREVWEGIEDKSQIAGIVRKIGIAGRWLFAYPALIYRYLRLPSHDAVLVSYMGHLDTLVLWPFAKIRRVPIVWDAFISIHNTVVEDRRMLSHANPVSWLIWAWEWLACRAADRVVLDTQSHANFFVQRFGIPSERVDSVFVGAEPEMFPVSSGGKPTEEKKSVLFYGQFIPLHGIQTIIHAARITQAEPIQWILIGRGQEEQRIRSLLEQTPLPRVQWLPWVSYAELSKWISNADVCLGIFGDSEKASRVIPNKVFQIIMAGKPLITRDSPAIRELLSSETEGVRLIPPADPEALAEAVRLSRMPANNQVELYSEIRNRISPQGVGRKLHAIVAELVRQ